MRRWRREWEEGGADALRSKGPASVERLSPRQWERLEGELKRGPLAHGWDDEFQGWTPKRVKLAAGRRTAADLGAHICFEGEAGQGLRPPHTHHRPGSARYRDLIVMTHIHQTEAEGDPVPAPRGRRPE
ncbi:hypothetical protein [Streptomyces sp. NPDC004629]|uniref:hypothetical protein n=1 Tax=Streptomyces sp. NPDC004629 TaxID=3364705 RepID=UPI0036BD5C12